ncbi:hypothetical protein ACHAXA_006221 [Cyclostephanos tholiformis]|uniref:Helicase-associated domain-containing protein n=1 Tax=Cyclostephanos tholiformis TaxID=382380 RepID=A0ABD3SE93_9STRA
MNAGNHEKEAPTNQSHRHPEGFASVHSTPISSPQRAETASREDSFYPGYSPVALSSASIQGNMEQYFVEKNAQSQNQNQFYQANSNELSPTLDQHENCLVTTEEGLMFEDSSYGDEIARWMEDHRRFQQQEQLGHTVQVQQERIRGESFAMLTVPSNEALSNSCEVNIVSSGTVSEIHLKRPASQLSDSTSSEKLSTKRRQRSQPLSQPSPQSALPDNRSSARRRMDDALQERSQTQMALRDALLALENAKAIVHECRSRYNCAKSLVESTAKEECESLLREDTAWNDMFRKLKEYKEETGDCNVKQNVSSDKTEDNKTPPETIRRLSAWVGKNRKEHKQRSACKSSKVITEGNASDESESELADIPSTVVSPDESESDILRSDELDPDSIHADPYKRVALDSIGFDWDPRNSRWNNMYEELRLYKDKHGNTLVPHANFGLGAWVKRQQVQYTLYCKGDGTKSDLTDERVRMLNDLGFIWSRRINTWNENFQRLTKWREIHGSCQIPDDSKDPEVAALHKWVADQRVHYKRQIAEEDPLQDNNCEDKACNDVKSKKKSKRKPSKLSPDKISKLEGIGFEFDSRDAKWLQKLDVLLEYKKKHGDFLVPSSYPDDPTLSNWVASQRAQYKLYLKGSKSHMTEKRLKILTDAGFPFSVNGIRQKVKKEAAHQDRVVFDAKPWIEKFKDFLLYIAGLESHGSLESLQKAYPYLAEWVEKQGEKCTSSDDATSFEEIDHSQGNLEPNDRISLMKAAKFFVFCQINKSHILLLHDKTSEPSSTIKEESTSWDDQFGNLAAWYIKHGTYSPKGMPSKMKKFVSRQQEQHRLFTSGLDSELTSERVEKLEDICFPVDRATAKEPLTDDTALMRRNKTWEEYRLELAIFYIQKGNYDADDIDLRRWAAEQKRQHKLYLTGKQSSLTFSQIQKLVDIKFISKRPKQKSWCENCADLMAFRIQFGSFDVASAHIVVPNSKGRPIYPSIDPTPLKMLQEWVTKLRGHFCELTKLVETNDDLTQEQKVKLDSVGYKWSGSWVSEKEKNTNETDFPPAVGTSIGIPSIKSNIFGMTLELQR